MEFLGVGPMELFFILILALIILGPKDIVKAGRTLGRWMRTIVTSSGWRAVTQTSRELRDLPTRLMRDAGIEDEMKQIQDLSKTATIDPRELIGDINTPATQPPANNPPSEVLASPPIEDEATILAPSKSDDLSDWTTPVVPDDNKSFTTNTDQSN